jgi:transcriptional regulator with XRE-family HTH domain
MKTGDRIKARRQELGLTVDEVAERLGINRATVYRYESHEIEKLPAPVLEPLAKVLKTTPGELMGWPETKHISDKERRADAYEMARMSDDPVLQGLITALDKLLGLDRQESDETQKRDDRHC